MINKRKTMMGWLHFAVCIYLCTKIKYNILLKSEFCIKGIFKVMLLLSI